MILEIIGCTIVAILTIDAATVGYDNYCNAKFKAELVTAYKTKTNKEFTFYNDLRGVTGEDKHLFVNHDTGERWSYTTKELYEILNKNNN